ncbi:MAG TPA: polymer-forming cytoskeletal family protein [Leucothrix sp.]|nr:polymer-forming cytoskeletal family protein [Leucothrix sp.]
MFGKKKKTELLRTQINTLIGEGTTVTGIVQFDGGLHVVGAIKGGAKSEDENSVLIISEDALVTGDIYVNHLIVNGQVDGNIYATGKVELFDKARINGDVHYNVLELPAGAEVNGKLIRKENTKGSATS